MRIWRNIVIGWVVLVTALLVGHGVASAQSDIDCRIEYRFEGVMAGTETGQDHVYCSWDEPDANVTKARVTVVHYHDEVADSRPFVLEGSPGFREWAMPLLRMFPDAQDGDEFAVSVAIRVGDLWSREQPQPAFRLVWSQDLEVVEIIDLTRVEVLLEDILRELEGVHRDVEDASVTLSGQSQLVGWLRNLVGYVLVFLMAFYGMWLVRDART